MTERLSVPESRVRAETRAGAVNLLTTRELADYLGLSTATVLRRWRDGELPGYRLASNVLRFDRGEVDEWLSGKRKGPGAGEVPPIPPRSRPRV